MTSNLNCFDITLPAIILETMKQDCRIQWITIHFHVPHYYTRFCSIRYTARTNSAYYGILTLSTHANHVCDYITSNYTSMKHRIVIYLGTVSIYRDLTRISVSDIKSEYISHHVSGNNFRKNDTWLTGTINYDIFPRITRLNTVLQHSIHCKDEFRVFQDINFVHSY